MPKSVKENERIRTQSKDKIISAAIRVFSQKGYAATNINDIAKEASISVGLMYRYFASKQELFESIVSFAVSGLAEVAKILSGEGNPKELIDSVCLELLNDIDNDDFIHINMLIIQSIFSDENKIGQIILHHDEKMFKAMEKLIERGQSEGIFASGDPAAKSALFFSAIQGMTMMKFLFKESFKVPTVLDLTAFLYEVKNGNNN